MNKKAAMENSLAAVFMAVFLSIDYR